MTTPEENLEMTTSDELREWAEPIASEAVSAMDSPLSGSRYHFSYHSGPSRYQFQTSLLLRLHRSIPSLITAIFL